ncbi:unnamed protein product, partial [Laminaria digitata]
WAHVFSLVHPRYSPLFVSRTGFSIPSVVVDFHHCFYQSRSFARSATDEQCTGIPLCPAIYGPFISHFNKQTVLTFPDRVVQYAKILSFCFSHHATEIKTRAHIDGSLELFAVCF